MWTNDKNISGQKPRVDQMSDFTKVLTAENVELNLSLKTRDEVLKKLSQMAQSIDESLDSESVYGRFLLRERGCSTALGEEIALPHAIDQSVTELTMQVITLDQPILWTAKEEVSVIIAFLIPAEEKNYQHVEYLASVAYLLQKKHFVSSLKKAKTEAEIVKLFEDRENF
ncbi:hypothetical protein FD29_GL000926 [Companilactobacillus mindensis DSM 14500]|uniref:PTS EIIA type-2 domain-containing protein n=1 Tax=Companilactobacillus mindensis DSM 14500 TaxID=1423770 RepID=A0A0R1QQN6_9LACO|nr:hypothetical protein FD29_GL000926 [Companilactobacillus mindensis DSM 14500]